MTFLTTLSLLSSLQGCTAGKATYQMIELDRMYARAETTGAEQLAPYYMTRATLYREKAWEEWGDASYGEAERLAQLAIEAAREAEELALYGSEEQRMIERLEALPTDAPAQGAPIDFDDEEE